MLWGAIISAIVGILNQYEILSLEWYRLQYSDDRLQSFFVNPNWFSEFIAISIPFILLGFVRTGRSLAWIGFLLSVLITCEIAIILSGSRTGWVVYPIVLITCWFFFYFSRKEEKHGSKYNLKSILMLSLKVAISVPLTIAISFFIIFQVIENFNNPVNLTENTSKNQHAPVQSKEDISKTIKETDKHSQYIVDRVSRITSPMTRSQLWMESIQLIREKPIFGLGYESYNWHKAILGSLPDSYLSRNRKLDKNRNFDTPHSTISQISVSGGVTGLLIWISIIGVMMFLCLCHFKKTGDYFSFSLMLFVISFHIYGLAQSMQYVSVIWFTIFLGMGYCLTLDESILVEKLRNILKKWSLFLAAIVLIGCFNYIINHSSKDLAEKYNLQIYAKDQNRDDFPGFYHQEQWPDGKIRWSGRAGIIKVEGEGLVEVRFFCGHPDISNQPVTLSVSLDGNLIDQIEFGSQRKITKQYFTTDSSPKKHEFLFEVSRTWSPLKSRVNVDSRGLGVAVSNLKFVGNTLEHDIGFYQPEIWKGAFPDEGSRISPIQFRWATYQASLVLTKKDRVNGLKTFVMATHPDNRWYKPVTLKILSGGQILKELKMTNQWQKIELTQHELKEKRVLTFQVNRTWNPKRYGVSNDNRNLGVAVARLNLL
jgi:O-antigen ligase